jgi:ketosteroid isomerase-like protein
MHRVRLLAVLAILIGFVSFPLAPPALAQTGPSVEDIHNALRDLKARAVEAVNKQDIDALVKDMAPDIVFTAMDNTMLKGADSIKGYYAKMFTGAGKLIDSMTVTMEADDLSKLLADNQVAVATGSANAHFKMAIGKEFDWPLRWSAVLTRQDNAWSVVNAHFSGNAVDNPLITASQAVTSWIPWAMAVGGLVVGFVLSRLLRRGGRA